MLKKILKRMIIGIIALYLLAMLLIGLFQERLLFRSESLPFDYKFQLNSFFEEINLESKDGRGKLNGLHFRQPNSKGVILYFHGNKGTLERWGKWAEKISKEHQYDILVWDYRGYGKSIGDREIDAMLEDGMLFYEYCKSLYGEENITIWGRSLGGAFASYVASKNDPKKVILESTFTNISEIAKQQYPFLPMDLLLRFPFQSEKNVGRITETTFILHGTSDALIPFSMGEELFERSAAKEKRMFSIEGGGHNGMGLMTTYQEAINEILR